MRFARRRSILGAALLALSCAMPAAAQDAPFPNRPIRLVVGFAAGGGNDLVARILAPKLSELLGQPVIVENRTGAGGRIGVTSVKSQPADGHSIIVGAIGQLAVSSVIYPDLPFHPTNDLIPESTLAVYPTVIVGPTEGAIRTLADLVAFAKANPTRSNYPSASPVFTLATELLKLKTGMPAQMVPYRGTNEMLLSVAGGQTSFAVAETAATAALAQAGKVRVLAVAYPTRVPEFPDAPTTTEAGFPDVQIRPLWTGALVAAGTPPAIVRRLEEAFRITLADAEVQKRIRGMAYVPQHESADVFKARIDEDIRTFRGIVEATGLKFE